MAWHHKQGEELKQRRAASHLGPGVFFSLFLFIHFTHVQVSTKIVVQLHRNSLSSLMADLEDDSTLRTANLTLNEADKRKAPIAFHDAIFGGNTYCHDMDCSDPT
jgi:hypothetical protein